MFYIMWGAINVSMLFFCNITIENSTFWIVQAILLVGSFIKSKD